MTSADDLLRKLEPILKDKSIAHLDFKIISEWTEYFRDMLHLKEKLQEAKGELNLERFKDKLIK